MLHADLFLIMLAASSAAFGLALVAVVRAHDAYSAGIVSARRTAAFWVAGVMVLAVTAWAVVAALHRLQTIGLLLTFHLPSLERILAYLIALQALIFLLLTDLFQRRTPRAFSSVPGTTLPSRRRRLATAAPFYALAAWILAGVVFYENWLNLRDALFQAGSLTVYRWDAARIWLLLGWLAGIGGAAWITLRDRQAARSPLHRNRNHYWTAGLLFLFAGHLLALGGNVLVELARASAGPLQMLGTLAAVYALATHHLPDLRTAARQVTRYAILTVVTLGLYALVFAGMLGVARLIPGHTADQQWIAIGTALAVAGLLHPIVRFMDSILRRLFLGAGYDLRRTLAEYSSSISSILDMEMLATIAIGLISEALEISRGALITVEPVVVEPPADSPVSRSAGAEQPTLPRAGYRLRPITGMGEALPQGMLPPNSPAAASLRRDRRPVTQFDLDLHPLFRDMQPAERDWWSSLQMDLYVPIYAKETWIGLLALGPKISGDRYFAEDLAFVQTLADQTAVAFENARLFDHLKQRNAENERLNAELTAANIELARLDQAKSNFINIASHELRTPLTQIIGYNDILSEMVRFDLSLPDALPMTDAIRRASRRLEEIVDTMFDVSKLDTRTLDLHLEEVFLASVVSSAADVWRAGMEERGLRLALRGLEDLPTVMADPKRMTQVFANLIQNAVRATPDGGMIIISGHPFQAEAPQEEPGADETNPFQEGPSSWVEVIVADTGIGIDQDELERIFDKFYRVGNVLLHSSGETKFKGAGPGLGLSVARGIVEAHGGRIWAESPGRDETACPGARFHVLLPVLVETEQAVENGESLVTATESADGSSLAPGTGDHAVSDRKARALAEEETV